MFRILHLDGGETVMILTVYEQTKQHMDFDPDVCDVDFNPELPEDLYPHSIDSFIDFLNSGAEVTDGDTAEHPTITDAD
jgi:hypothetical protein